MISPFKAAIGGDYKLVEKRLMAAIFLRFGLPAEPPPDLAKAIKAADRIAAYLEATALAGFSVAEARKFFGAPQACLERLRPLSEAAAPGRGAAGFPRPLRRARPPRPSLM